jgi:hypothetical protein
MAMLAEQPSNPHFCLPNADNWIGWMSGENPRQTLVKLI